MDKTREQLQEELAQLQRLRAQERAIEHIRNEVLSMRSAEDLLQVILVVFKEFVRLNLDTVGCGFFFVDEDEGRILWYTALDNPRQYGISWTSPELKEVDETTAVTAIEVPITEDWQEDLRHWRQGQTWTVRRDAAEDWAEMQPFHQRLGFDRRLPYFGQAGWVITNVPFAHGWVGIRHREAEIAPIIKADEWIEALSLGYMRNLDFQRLEAQNEALAEALGQLKEAQGQLVLQEKMASLGNLVAGVAHEMNTPLGAIRSMHDTLMRAVAKLAVALGNSEEFNGDRRVQAVLKVVDDANRVIADGVDRVTGIVHSLRDFARLDEAEFQIVDVHECLDSALGQLQHQWSEKITVHKAYGQLAPLYCAPGKLNQVFLNLLKNAGQAMDGKGQIDIQTAQHDGQACLLIRDTGRGMPPDQLERLFDFDFKATDSRVKVGFGLYTAHAIVQEHKGTMTIKSQEGKGTEVAVCLPVRQTDRG